MNANRDLNVYDVRGIPNFNGGMYGANPGTITQIRAHYYSSFEGELNFYTVPEGEVERELVASFAPGRWDCVVRVDFVG